METSEPADLIRPNDVAEIDDVIFGLERTVTLEDLARHGKSEFRVVSRKALVLEMLGSVESFISARATQLEDHLASILERRERESRDEERHRVLDSVVDLADLVDTLVHQLEGGAHAAAGKALDRRLDRLLRTHGFERVETTGKPFDSRWHEIVDEACDPAVDEGTVLREIGRGYRSDDFVLRVARVVINERTA